GHGPRDAQQGLRRVYHCAGREEMMAPFPALLVAAGVPVLLVRGVHRAQTPRHPAKGFQGWPGVIEGLFGLVAIWTTVHWAIALLTTASGVIAGILFRHRDAISAEITAQRARSRFLALTRADPSAGSILP